MKKTIAMILTVCMCGTMLTACGGGAAKETTAAKAAETTAAAVKEAAAKETEGSAETAGTTFGLTPLEERTTLRIGFFSGSAHGMPFYIADEMGFFDELNIDVEYESFIGGPAMMEASASWDICDVGGPGVLNGMKNYDIHMIGICDNESNTALFVRPDSDLAKDPTNPEMWNGKKVILNTGTTLQYMCAQYLESIGTSIDNVEVISMDVTSGLTAFKAGEADAMCAWNAVAYNADDEGYVRVTDMGQMELNNICGLCATQDAIDNKSQLIETAWMVYYMTGEWMKANEENKAKAVELYVESCEDEGVISNESICERALDVFNVPTVKEAYAEMTTKETDRAGSGEVYEASNLLFETLDFFITLGSYTAEDRQNIIDKGLVDPAVAENCAETLKALGYVD